jgi:hypothetical protein
MGGKNLFEIFKDKLGGLFATVCHSNGSFKNAGFIGARTVETFHEIFINLF